MIMRTSLVAGVKHCNVFSESGGSGKSYSLSLMTKLDRMRAILYVKYFEKELHNVSNEECSRNVFNFCRCRIVFTDLWTSGESFQNLVRYNVYSNRTLTSCDCIYVAA